MSGLVLGEKYNITLHIKEHKYSVPAKGVIELDGDIDKVYIDGPCGSNTLADVLLARFERVSHVTHFYKKDQ